MIFIDDSTSDGAKIVHKSFDNLSDEWKDNYKKDRTGREFKFTSEIFTSLIIQIM